MIESDHLQIYRELEIAKYREDARQLVASIFKHEDGTPIILCDGQCDLFNIIYKKIYPRVHVRCHTRYGKSLVIALAVLMRVSTYPEVWAIVSGNDEQAGIIMGYINQHIFDHDYMRKKFERPKGISDEYILRHRNQKRVNFVLGKSGTKPLLGEVFISNAKGAIGFGAGNVVLDESPLIPDADEALVFRMTGDKPDNFYCQIGNAFESDHFRKSEADPSYFKMIIDWQRGMKEGRITQAQVDEARNKPFFRELYDVKFPELDSMDDGGWSPLLTRDDIDRALVEKGSVQGFGINKLGVDVAGEGRNFSIIVQRHTNIAKLIWKKHTPDTMDVAEQIINTRRNELLQQRYLNPADITIDKVGVGAGVFNITAKELMGVQGINVGEKPYGIMDKELYLNIRAMGFWKVREWILRGGKLEKNDESLDDTWYQLTKIKYRKKLEGMKGKLQIMPKEQMLKLGIESPDVADGIMLTFVTPDVLTYDSENMKEDFDPHQMFPL